VSGTKHFFAAHDEPFIAVAEAVAHLGLPSAAALHSLIYRRRLAGTPLPTYRLGVGRNAALMFRRSELGAAMRTEGPVASPTAPPARPRHSRAVSPRPDVVSRAGLVSPGALGSSSETESGA